MNHQPERVAGTESRLEALFEAQHGRLYRLARRLAGDADEARDLTQETFLRAARHVAALPVTDEAAGAWLVRVLVNLCRDRARRRRTHERLTPRPSPVSSPPGPESLGLLRHQVRAALAALTPRRRAVAVLHYYEDRDVAEIATLLGLTRVTVRWHLAAARRDLARDLGPSPGVDHD